MGIRGIARPVAIETMWSGVPETPAALRTCIETGENIIGIDGTKVKGLSTTAVVPKAGSRYVWRGGVISS
jgi:hypothetical protein